jgi:hypothetical protein
VKYMLLRFSLSLSLLPRLHRSYFLFLTPFHLRLHLTRCIISPCPSPLFCVHTVIGDISHLHRSRLGAGMGMSRFPLLGKYLVPSATHGSLPWRPQGTKIRASAETDGAQALRMTLPPYLASAAV